MRKEFVIKAYGRTELAQLYFPDVCPGSAWRRLREWIRADVSLSSRLKETGYGTMRSFTPRQVRLIAEHFGEP